MSPESCVLNLCSSVSKTGGRIKQNWNKMRVKRKKYFKAWADLLDLGFETALGNLKAKKGGRRDFRELKGSLTRQNEEHLKMLSTMLKRMK